MLFLQLIVGSLSHLEAECLVAEPTGEQALKKLDARGESSYHDNTSSNVLPQ